MSGIVALRRSLPQSFSFGQVRFFRPASALFAQPAQIGRISPLAFKPKSVIVNIPPPEGAAPSVASQLRYGPFVSYLFAFSLITGVLYLVLPDDYYSTLRNALTGANPSPAAPTTAEAPVSEVVSPAPVSAPASTTFVATTAASAPVEASQRQQAPDDALKQEQSNQVSATASPMSWSEWAWGWGSYLGLTSSPASKEQGSSSASK